MIKKLGKDASVKDAKMYSKPVKANVCFLVLST